MNTRLKIALACAIVLIMAPMAYAGEQVIKIYPTALLKGLMTAEYEWATGADMSNVAQVGIASLRTTDGKSTAFSGGFGIHKYLDGKALDGLYLGGAVTVVGANVVNTTTSESASALVVGVNGRAGYKLMIGESILVDVAVHAALPVYATAAIGSENATGFGAGPFGAGISLGIGYTW